MSTALTAAALVAVPIGIGGLLGLALRPRSRRRFAGLVALAACIGIPMAVVAALNLWFPLIGLWDALLEGFLLGAGVACTAHGVFAGRRQVALAATSLVASLVALELACRVFLPPPPGFPTAGPHLLLADAMRADADGHSWNLRSKEIVCSVIYTDQYPGILDVSGERDFVLPQTFTNRADRTRRVLHLGDSMTFGLGVTRDETFTAALERLEPHTQHINAGIPNTAPDAYLLVLERWVATHDVHLAVMHVFEGNDLNGLDDDYPCCQWQSLLTYGSEVPAMRCPTAAQVEFRRAGLTWLQYNSPPPYLVRALIPYSAAAAHVGAAIVSRRMVNNPVAAYNSEEIGLTHLESILRRARDQLRAIGIPFVVVVLPTRAWVEDATAGEHPAPKIMQVSRRLGIPAFDASDILRDAVMRGQHVFLDAPTDPHLSPTGNELLADWLHDQLPTVTRDSVAPWEGEPSGEPADNAARHTTARQTPRPPGSFAVPEDVALCRPAP